MLSDFLAYGILAFGALLSAHEWIRRRNGYWAPAFLHFVCLAIARVLRTDAAPGVGDAFGFAAVVFAVVFAVQALRHARAEKAARSSPPAA